MKIIGWIRKDDVAACGAVVLDGFANSWGRGRPFAGKGARMSCTKGCLIAEGVAFSTVGGVPRAIHGSKTTCGCPLISTLNDVDGVGNTSGADIPIRYIMENGKWIGKHNEGFDQYFLLVDEVTEAPLANRLYRIECNGKTFEGRTDAFGKTGRVETNDPAHAEVTIFPEGV